MKKYSLKFSLTLMLLASALTCLVLALTVGRGLGLFGGRFDDVREYAAILRKIDELYIGNYDPAEISGAAMTAAVDALGDRWSQYMTPREYEMYLDYSNNRFAGIGVGVVADEETGGIGISYVYRGSPADAAGIVAGDVITGIDGNDITNIGIDEMRTLLARPIGDTVELTVLRADGSVELLIAVYSYVFTDPVICEMLDGDIGYIIISNFDLGAAESFITGAEGFLEQGAKAFVFDVRGNGGGRVSELTSMLDYLLPEGEIFVAVTRGGGEEIIMSDASTIDIPAVVLVDRYSFSAAEYFAAMLKEYGYADVVGEQTTGKNRSQVTMPLPGGGALHISSGQYLTKNRVSLFDTDGLSPDHTVILTDDQFSLLTSGNLDKDADPQLETALLLLKEK